MREPHCSRIGLSVAFVVDLLLGCQIAKGDFVLGEPEPVASVNSESADISPSITVDGLELYFASNRGHGADMCYCDIWVATRASTDAPWEALRNLGAPVNRPYGADANPCISADGLELYFSDVWPGFIQDCAARPGGYGSGDIWVSKRETREADWGTPTNLGLMVNSADYDGTPHLSTDGLSLYFSSNRAPGNGGDFYVCTRLTKDDDWGPAVDLGAPINTMAVQDYLYYPFLSYDGLSLFFTSVPWPWAGNEVAINGDIFLSTRPSRDDSWGIPWRIPVLSSGRNDWGVTFASGDSVIYFQRSDPLDLAPGPAQATSDLWRVEVTPVMDLNGDGAIDKLDLAELQDHIGNTDNSLYDIAPMPMGDGIADDKDLRALMEYVFPVQAAGPNPANKATGVPHDSVLRWESGEFAQTHDVYLGTDFDDVNDATLGDALHRGRHESTSFDPGQLDFGETYYWRVDEVNGPPEFTVFKGDIWSFTVEPYGIPITNITATASSENTDMEAAKTIDGSGLNGLDRHSTEATDMWLSVPGDTPWVQYEFDRVYKLHEMWVWNSNQVVEYLLGFGARDVVIEYATDGSDWKLLDGVPQFAQATGQADYVHNTTVDFGGVLARFVRITITSGWGMMSQYGLSEVRFFYIPTQAREPHPAADSTVDTLDVALEWRAGREAVLHQVHFSRNRAAVADGTALVGTTSTPRFDLSGQGLELGSTYYWRVDEVNEAESPSIHLGDVWSFSTPDYLVVDDFDQYDDNCNRIFFAWEDGLGHSGGTDVDNCDAPPSSGNGGGATVGHNQAPFAEQTIVNGGSTQSMPFGYDNSYGKSEATLTLNGQDWTMGGIQTLTLFFYGQPTRRKGQLYVKINDAKVAYDGDITQERWQQWNIDLTSLEGLQNVTKLTIGVDGANAAGMLYIDDIRLYP